MSEGFGAQLLAPNTPDSAARQIIHDVLSYAPSDSDDLLLRAPLQRSRQRSISPSPSPTYNLHTPPYSQQSPHYSPQPVPPAHDSYRLSPQATFTGVPDEPPPAHWHAQLPVPTPDSDSFSFQGAVLDWRNGEHLHGLDTPQGSAEDLNMDEPTLVPNAYPAVYALGVPGVPEYAPLAVYRLEGLVTPQAHPVALPQQHWGASASSVADSADDGDVDMGIEEDEVEAMVTPPPTTVHDELPHVGEQDAPMAEAPMPSVPSALGSPADTDTFSHMPIQLQTDIRSKLGIIADLLELDEDERTEIAVINRMEAYIRMNARRHVRKDAAVPRQAGLVRSALQAISRTPGKIFEHTWGAVFSKPKTESRTGRLEDGNVRLASGLVA